jgi:hypothetical protein
MELLTRTSINEFPQMVDNELSKLREEGKILQSLLELKTRKNLIDYLRADLEMDNIKDLNESIDESHHNHSTSTLNLNNSCPVCVRQNEQLSNTLNSKSFLKQSALNPNFKTKNIIKNQFDSRPNIVYGSTMLQTLPIRSKSVNNYFDDQYKPMIKTKKHNSNKYEITTINSYQQYYPSGRVHHQRPWNCGIGTLKDKTIYYPFRDQKLNKSIDKIKFN